MSAGRADVVRSAVAANLGLLLMVVIWGAMFPAIERILQTWDVISATAGRHTLAVVALLVRFGLVANWLDGVLGTVGSSNLGAQLLGYLALTAVLPGVALFVLVRRSRGPRPVAPALAPDLARILFEESTTIGVRWTAYERARLPREMVTLATSLGSITFKVSRLEGRPVTVTPEFEEIRRIARVKGLPVREALERAREEGRRLLG